MRRRKSVPWGRVRLSVLDILRNAQAPQTAQAITHHHPELHREDDVRKMLRILLEEGVVEQRGKFRGAWLWRITKKPKEYGLSDVKVAQEWLDKHDKLAPSMCDDLP